MASAGASAALPMFRRCSSVAGLTLRRRSAWPGASHSSSRWPPCMWSKTKTTAEPASPMSFSPRRRIASHSDLASQVLPAWAGDRVHRRPCPHAGELTRSSGRDGAELLHHGGAVELRPEVGYETVLEAVEVHALDPDRLAGGGDPHELLLQGTGHEPPRGDGVAAGDDVLQVLLQVGEDRPEARDLLLEAGQRRLMAGGWIVVDQARVAGLVDRRLVGRAKRVLEARDDLDVAGRHDILH